LFQADIYEEGYYISEDNLVPLPRFKLKAVLHAGIELGLYDPDLLDGSINDSVFEAADRLLDYSKMNLLYFGGLRQLEEKYLIKYNGQLFEDPQQHFMLIALTTLHADIRTYPNGKEDAFQLETLENYYIIQSHGEANNPTPFSVGLRTPFKQYDSCCLISIDDSDDSIAFGNLTGQKATVAGAGIGMTIGPIRSKDRPIRGGKMPHMGNLGYLGQISKTIKASNQVSRGGSATINLPMWTRDYYDLIMLKDISGIEGENRYRHLDYCWHYSKYMLHKLKTNGKILLHSPDEKLPDGRFAYNAFYHVNENGVYDDSAYVVWCEE
jgi:ribonucleoside-diphosphate reductase alpha chain